MKRSIQKILWVVAIIAGLIIIGASVFLIGFISATRSMTPAETGAINDTVWCIKDRFVNAYIFKGNNSYLMVDAGFGKQSFAKELKQAGLAPEQISTLLLTHTDGDHIGATGLFKNIKIYMHTDEEQMINGTTGKSKFAKTKWKYGPYKLLGNNDTLTLDGLKIKIIHTPGHTPGSSCYLIGDDYLVTGDNLVVTNGKYEHFVEKFNMDTPKQIESIMLLPLPGSIKYVLTGHHGVEEFNKSKI
jgi:glyoxylase-like metal-dependent hydrolase (beta-lactamase superfamily II)